MEGTGKKETFKTKEGKEVTIEHNGNHFIAYNDKNEAVGLPWVKIESLKDELGIAYDKVKTKAELKTEKEERAIEEPEPTVLEVQGVLRKDGTKIKCVKKKTHWYAYNEKNEQIGQPWILLNDLCEDIGLSTSLEISKTAEAAEGQPEHNQFNNPLGAAPETNNAETKMEDPEEETQEEETQEEETQEEE